jgi:hypothetical protein
LGVFEKIRVDYILEGSSLIKDTKNAGLENVEDVNFSDSSKIDISTLLKLA